MDAVGRSTKNRQQNKMDKIKYKYNLIFMYSYIEGSSIILAIFQFLKE